MATDDIYHCDLWIAYLEVYINSSAMKCSTPAYPALFIEDEKQGENQKWYPKLAGELWCVELYHVE